MVHPVHMTAIPAAPEFRKKRVSIKTVEDSGDHPALANTVCEGEEGREHVVPLDISILLHVDEHEKSENDEWQSSIKEFLEHETMLNKVKSLGHVHAACEHVRASQLKRTY